MTEKIGFSPAENEAIGQEAINIARLGEECVFDLIQSSYDLKMVKYILLKSCSPEEVLKISRYMDHEIAIIREVIFRAQVVMQFSGTDTESQLDRIRQEMGLGSRSG